MIADIRGYTRFTVEHGDQAAANLAGRFAELATEIVNAGDGQVIELRGDEALAVFTSARQALRTSIELQERFLSETRQNPEFPLKVGIGLDSGEAIPVDRGFRGASLNLAARLCALAGAGEVLASDTVSNLARKLDGVSYADRGTVQLKGFGDPVRVVEVQDAARRAADSSLTDSVIERPLPIGGFLGALPSGLLVAREEELRRVLATVDRVSGGTGQLVLLAGESGAGKTRLAQEVTLAVRNRGFLLATGTSYQPRETVPYYPFLDVLSNLYGGAPPNVRSAVADRWPYLGRLLPEAGIPASPHSEGQEEQERLFRAVTGFVQAIAEQVPVAILLDDLQWADAASLDLLQHLTRQTRAYRVLLLATYRDVDVGRQHPLEQALRDLNRQQLLERIPIRRLGQDGTADLVARSFGQEHISDEFAELVHRHTEGNPFFTQEVLRALVERGDIYRDDGHWELRELAEIEVPESVRSTIGERLSRLSEDAQEMLRDATVIGHTFTFDVLQAVGSRTEDELERALEEAISAALLRETGKDEYGFNHALTQQALYAELSGRRKRRLHLAVGEALERLREPKRAERVQELARHFREGDDIVRALRYTVLAGEQSESVFAHEEAERQFREALELARDIEDRSAEAMVLERLGAVLKIRGRYPQALEALELAARLHREARDLEAEGIVTAQIGSILSLGPAPEDAVKRLHSLVETLEPRGPSQALALLYAALVRLYNRTGNQHDQLAATQRLLELARGLGDDRLLAEAQFHYGNSLVRAGRFDEALSVLEESIHLSEEVGDLSTLCAALDCSSVTYHSIRRFDRVMQYRERAFQVAERLGDPREASYRAVQVSYLAFLLGDWKQARDYAERSLNYALALDELRAYLQPLHALGELCLYEGQAEDATGYLKEYSLIADRLRSVESSREAQALQAEVDILNGDPETALDRLRPFLDRPGWEDHLAFLLPLAWAYLENGCIAEAENAATRGLSEATRQGAPVGTIEALRVEGIIASRQGNWPLAESRYAEALRLAREILYPWGEARAHYGLGLMHRRKGDPGKARAHLEAARDLFVRLGARIYEERAVEALRQI